MGRGYLLRLWRRAEWSLISRFGAERVARSGGCQNPNKAGWKPNFLHSPGQRPEWKGLLSLSPCKGNSIEPQIVALTGRIVYWIPYTQGVALGYELLPFQGVLFRLLTHSLFLQYRALNSQFSTLNSQFSILNSQFSTLNSQPSTNLTTTPYHHLTPFSANR